MTRLSLAFTQLPSVSGWLWTGAFLFIYGYMALAIAERSSLFTRRFAELEVGKLALLALVAVISPSLIEEAFYRAVLLPHPSEGASAPNQLFSVLLSLGLYVGAHPLLAATFWPWSRRYFYRPAFLLIVTLLGAACSASYLATGSVYAPLLIHWLTIVVWKFLYGGPDFRMSRVREKC